MIATLEGRWVALLLAGVWIWVGCGGPPVTVEKPSQPEGWDAELALPVAEDLDPSPGVVAVELTARPQKLELRPGTRTELWTYNGTVPGPLIRANRGDRLVVRFKNELPEPTTLHWHGLRVPASMDGSEAVQDPVEPGEVFEYAFDLLDAGTFWYHPHVRSSAQVGYGLYGAIVVEDPSEPPLGDELVLVLSDIGVDAEGKLAPGDESGWFGDYFGREGNLLLVNGRVRPTLKARAGVPQRWRIINAARARYFRFQVPGQALIRIGGDGGLSERPLPVREVTLAPGERAEVFLLPRPQADGPVMIQWLDSNRFHIELLRAPEDLLAFEVTPEPPFSGAPLPPDLLRSIEPFEVLGAHVRTIEMMEKEAPGGAVLGINGKTAAESEPIHVHVGAREVWEVTNSTNYDHPFHLHGFFFQVLGVDGQPPPVREWKDTLNVLPKQKIRLGVAFDDRPGMWMFHCHILDHADLGMMGMLMLTE